jgi:hypothetical protein
MFFKEQKERISLIYKGFIVLAAVVGILLQCEIRTSDFSLSSFLMRLQSAESNTFGSFPMQLLLVINAFWLLLYRWRVFIRFALI